jgi:hypothetical protein
MPRPHQFPVFLSVLGALFMLNGVLGIQWLFDGAENFSETAASWQFATFQRVYLLLLVALTVLVPGFGALRGRSGRRIPSAVLAVLTGALVLQAGTVFTMAFVAPFYAEVAPATLDITDGGMFEASMSAVWVTFAVAVIAFGVAVLRSGTLPRATGVLLVVGALITPVLGPVGSILLGTAFVGAGISLRQPSDVLPVSIAG